MDALSRANASMFGVRMTVFPVTPWSPYPWSSGMITTIFGRAISAALTERLHTATATQKNPRTAGTSERTSMKDQFSNGIGNKHESEFFCLTFSSYFVGRHVSFLLESTGNLFSPKQEIPRSGELSLDYSERYFASRRDPH